MHTACGGFSYMKFGVLIMVSLKSNNVNKQTGKATTIMRGLLHNYNERTVTKATLAKTRWWLFQILSGVTSDLQHLCLVHGNKCLIINF